MNAEGLKETEKGAETTRRKRRAVSVRVYISVFLLLFLVIVLLVSWVFHVVLLDVIYESTCMQELEQAAKSVSAVVGTDQLKSVVYDAAMDGLMGIRVYSIDGERATVIATENGNTGAGQIFHINPEQMSGFYSKTKSAGGIYRTYVTFGGREIDHSAIRELLRNASGEISAENGMINQIYVQLCEDAGENEYMLLLSASLSPLMPMVHTLKKQFVWVSVILLISVVLVAFPLSKRLSKPIIQLNHAAKQLANGNYDADFTGIAGYRETEELGESLHFAAQELSRTDQLQKELIANISHDLRTPLTMIRGYAEAMRDIPGENTPENVQVLIDETEHLTELVNDMMDLSKIRSGVRCPVMEFFNLTTAIREVMARYEVFTRTQGYCIRLQADANIPVFADRGMILQVIYNLINNAINYTGADLCVTVRQRLLGDRVRIEVIDTGEGIAPDQIPLIWERYYKVDKVHRIVRVGTGLGLSIVKGVLDVHNATYGVESELGKGSVFWFELPVSVPPEGAVREEAGTHPTEP